MPDYEEKYNSQEFNVSCDNNIKQIQTISGVQTFRLSKIAKTSYNDFKMKIFANENIKEKIMNKIDYYSKNKFIVLGFEAESNFQARQIINDSVIGLMLEELIKNAILVDVQKFFLLNNLFIILLEKKNCPCCFMGKIY